MFSVGVKRQLTFLPANGLGDESIREVARAQRPADAYEYGRHRPRVGAPGLVAAGRRTRQYDRCRLCVLALS